MNEVNFTGFYRGYIPGSILPAIGQINISFININMVVGKILKVIPAIIFQRFEQIRNKFVEIEQHWRELIPLIINDRAVLGGPTSVKKQELLKSMIHLYSNSAVLADETLKIEHLPGKISEAIHISSDKMADLEAKSKALGNAFSHYAFVTVSGEMMVEFTNVIHSLNDICEKANPHVMGGSRKRTHRKRTHHKRKHHKRRTHRK
jgi:hypothetical protein